MTSTLLLVEDEPSLILTLQDLLEAEGYEVRIATNGNEALDTARTAVLDLIVLDVTLPGKNGFDVCRDLRKLGIEVPVLMLTARTQVTDRVLGLKLGADDYLTKPFESIELLARIEALLRRSSSGQPGGDLSFGDIRIDPKGAQVFRGREPLSLSALEFKLLVYLVEHPSEVISRDRLLDEVWGYEATPTTRTVDVHVSSLRQKVEPNPTTPRYIATVHGLGYRFDPD